MSAFKYAVCDFAECNNLEKILDEETMGLFAGLKLDYGAEVSKKEEQIYRKLARNRIFISKLQPYLLPFTKSFYSTKSGD